MKPRLDWHSSPFGRFVLFVGGLRFAVPVMVLVIGALAWGTYLDSTQGAKVAFRYVYGSGWFIAIMALVAVALIAAVVTRYPWKRRHVGFITVHTGLILLMLGGFWSLFGRVEGRLALAEGTAGSQIEIESQRLELAELREGELVPTEHASAEDHVTGAVRLGNHNVEILERWGNIKEESYVADDGPEPLRAVKLGFGPSATESAWVGEARKSGGPAFMGGYTIRVLGAGEAWQPPASESTVQFDYEFVLGDRRFPLGEEGQEALPGWTITRLRRFSSAIVGAGGISENESGGDNPAIDVTITDAKGNVERHTAFLKFPDMVLSKTIEGDTASGAQLKAPGSGGQSIVIHGEAPGIRVAYIGPNGVVRTFEHDGSLPWSFQAGAREVWVLEQVTRARSAKRFVEAPPANEFRPALVVRINDGLTQVLPWKGVVPVVPGQIFLRYGPRRVQLPFEIRLEDFRKHDYPGLDMAMSYESEVVVTTHEGEQDARTISMNQPYAYGQWKAYQSGFMGENISIFSVMKDPGLPLTYLGCIVLCLGIVVTFYSRRFSWGHPGIAMTSGRKESNDVATAADAHTAAREHPGIAGRRAG